jgi:hypothetical protein
MTEPDEKVSLVNLLRGGVAELFDDALQQVADNILDLNTSETAVRVVTLKVEVKPDVNRSIANTKVSVTPKLAPVKPASTTLYIGQQRGKGVLVEHNPEQQRLPLEVTKPVAVG